MEKNQYTPRQVGELLGLPHLEVIRRLRKGDITGHKLGWAWIIEELDLEAAKKSDWYQRRLSRQQRGRPQAASS